MNKHLSESEYTDNSMAARINATQKGQLSWADLSHAFKCNDCVFSYDAKKKVGKFKGYIICGKVKEHTKKVGTPFDPETAHACSMYEGGTCKKYRQKSD